VLRYESAIRGGQLLLLPHSTAGKADRAKTILEQTRPVELERHAGAAATRTA
jgi:hypothetical protein